MCVRERERDRQSIGNRQISMEILLEKRDLTQVRSVSHRDTLKLTAPGKKKKSKVAVGDDSGSVELFEIKKGATESLFRVECDGAGPVTALALGGTIEKPSDNIFASQGQAICGLKKKGKSFFKLISSLTETINHMKVESSTIWTGCEYIFNKYVDGNDAGFFMCHDRINSLLVEYLTRENSPDTLLGCQDRCIRVVQVGLVACCELRLLRVSEREEFTALVMACGLGGSRAQNWSSRGS